jgi:hypothetical protein
MLQAILKFLGIRKRTVSEALPGIERTIRNLDQVEDENDKRAQAEDEKVARARINGAAARTEREKAFKVSSNLRNLIDG